jgi:hypothetical protein
MSILSDYTILLLKNIYNKEFLVDIVMQYLKLRHFFLNKYKIYLIVFVTQIILEKKIQFFFWILLKYICCACRIMFCYICWMKR